MISTLSFGLVVILTLTLSASTVDCHKRVKRQFNHMPVQTADRSVYARRNFGLTDVVSDVYEVYVGPQNHLQGQPKHAVVIMGKDGVSSYQGAYGTLTLFQQSPSSSLFINGTLFNLHDGEHGLHVHMSGDLRQGCTSSGGHYNPYMLNHGDKTDRNRHIGDLGNIVSSEGVANVSVLVDLISLTGVNSVVGRAMVVHEKMDDLGRGGNEDSKKTGNSGARVACGVIGLIQ